MTDPHRNFCQRQHRILVHFLAIQAWTHGLECIAVDRDYLRKFFGLWNFKRTRIDWLIADAQPWFPYIELYWYSSGALASIFFSRVPMESFLPPGRMSD